MPSDDLILNVRQVGSYPIKTAPPTAMSDTLLVQQGGLGGAYYAIAASSLVGTSLAAGGNMEIDGNLDATTATITTLGSTTLAVTSSLTLAGIPVATTDTVNSNRNFSVHSFNGRYGDVLLSLQDVIGAGAAPVGSPNFQGCPTAPTPFLDSYSDRIATTHFVVDAINTGIQNLLFVQPFVFSFNQRWGMVTLQVADITSLVGTPQMDLLPITALNTFPALSQTAFGVFFLLIINGRVFVPPDGSFTVSGTTITWNTSNPYSVNPGDTVVAVYNYLTPPVPCKGGGCT